MRIFAPVMLFAAAAVFLWWRIGGPSLRDVVTGLLVDAFYFAVLVAVIVTGIGFWLSRFVCAFFGRRKE